MPLAAQTTGQLHIIAHWKSQMRRSITPNPVPRYEVFPPYPVGKVAWLGVPSVGFVAECDRTEPPDEGSVPLAMAQMRAG